MASGGNVNVTVVDGGNASIIVPGSSVQLVIGCSSIGSTNQIVATRSASTLQSNLGGGPLVESAALTCLAGGTVIAIKCAQGTAGSATSITGTAVNGGTSTVTVQGAVTLSSTTGVGVNPVVVTASAAHGYVTGDVVTIAGVTGNTNANGTFPITVLSSTTFSLPTSVTANGTGASGTSTKTPLDTYYVKFLVVSGGTIGTAGITFQVSLDAGRNYGPVLALGTANSYAIPNAGITLSFAAGTLVTGASYTFSTTEPVPSTATIQAALNAFQASAYAIQGVGSVHIVGAQTGANATTIQGYLDTLATGYVYTRAFMTARDASPAALWGGTAETESTWMAAIQTDYSAVAARRLCVGAAFWNQPSAFPNVSSTGASVYRRPITWQAAARQVTVPPQRHIGRVKDGSLSGVVVNPTSDPTDGFIYHDERLNPGLDYIINGGSGGRFMSTMTRTGLPGVYITNPLTMAPLGSDFFLMPLGNVMDVFSGIVHTVGQQQVDDDVRLNANGTIYENDARSIESAIAAAANAAMFSTKMISLPVQAGPTAAATGAEIIVDRTVNVKATSTVNIVGQINARGYVLTINVSLSYQNPNAAV
jgi:hypothetical protein